MKEVIISAYKRENDGPGGGSSGGFVDISSKLDRSIWDAEFEVLPDYLRAKRSMLFGGQVVVEGFEAGGGGASLPTGVLGDILYHNGADWVAKQSNMLGFATTTQLNLKLDKVVWEAEFEPTEDVLKVKRSALFGGQVVVAEYEAGGGGGADLPVGVVGDLLYHDGAAWVAKASATLGFATESWVTAKSYATESWVTARGFATTQWISSQNFATESWVSSRGYLTAITKQQVLGVMSGSGSGSQYLAGNGTFYTIGYSELSGKPDLSVYATTQWVSSRNFATTSWVADNYLKLVANMAMNGNGLNWNSVAFDMNALTVSQIASANYSGQSNYPWFGYGQLLTFGSFNTSFSSQIAISNSEGQMKFRGQYENNKFINDPWHTVWTDTTANTPSVDWCSRNMEVHGTLICRGQVTVQNF